jgi:acyl carrier protein phosphodiesterase
MNYLAHLLLSPPDPAFRIGNLLPDLLPLPQVERFEGAFRKGIERHRRIDAFTDAHPVVLASRERLWPDYRRFAGVIVDIVYDHCLIARWDQHCPQPVEAFVEEVHLSLPMLREHLPERTFVHLEALTQWRWIGAYRELEGVSTAMMRIGKRLRRPVDFSGLHAALTANRDGLLDDFDRFFPDLVEAVMPPADDPPR